MSTEATTSTTPPAEENVEQESLQSSKEGSVVEPKDVEQTPDDETVSSSFAAVDDNSDEAVADTITLLQQSNSEAGVAIGGANTDDSQGSSDSDGGDGTELPHGGSTDGGSGKDTQPDEAKSLKSKAVDAAEGRTEVQSVVAAEEGTEAQSIVTSTETSKETHPVAAAAATEVSTEGGVTRSTSGEDPVYRAVVEHGVNAPDPSLPLARLPLDFDDNELTARNEGCCDWFSRGCDAFCSKLKSCVRWIRGSKIYWAFQAFLLCVSIDYIFLGIEHIDKCPVMPRFPKLMIMLGMSFFISTLLSVVLELRETPRPQVRNRYLYAGMIIARLVFIILSIDGLVVTCTMSPSYDPKSESYCDEAFYNLIYFMNFFNLVVVLVSCCMRVPFLYTNDYAPL